MKLVMLGAPGAGKGTQAKMLAERYGIPHISTGDIFRSNIKEGTELGKKVKGFLDSGALVPDELTVDLVMDRIGQEDCRNGYILDGFPRTIHQAEKLTEALTGKGGEIDYAVNVDVPDEAIVERMSGRRMCPACGASYHVVNIPPKKEGICDQCGAELMIRPDDQADTVRKRLEVYHQETEPLKDYYQAKGILVPVDNQDTIEGTTQVIMEALKI